MIALWLPLLLSAEPLAESFPFVLPPLDASPTYVDLSHLSPGPAGAGGRAVIRDGHWYTPDGQRLRLFGTNLTFAAAFPDKELAPQIAARMRKFGMNVVRFHHIDGRTAPAGLWADASQTAFDPLQLDKLDWFIWQLKQHGIYINLNLHVSRTYAGAGIDELPYTFRYGKTIDKFQRELIELQKQYAKLLLTHRNPYTQTTYAEEPAVLIVELNNENTLVGQAFNKDLGALSERYLTPLTEGWRAWLKAKYGTLERVLAAWQAGVEPLGAELIPDGYFAVANDAWRLEMGGRGTARIQATGGPDNGPCHHSEMTSPGATDWAWQVHRMNLTLDEGRVYTVSFMGRADPPRSVSVGTRLQEADWHPMGLTAQVALTPQWTRHELTFTAVRTVPGKVRLSFNNGNTPGVVELAGVSLKPGAGVKLPPGTTLDTLPIAHDAGLLPQKTDWVAYLAATEQAYVSELKSYLTGELGVQAAICDSQASYGGIAGVDREASLSDFVDMHAYWQHPRFPGRPWDGNNWFIGNTPMTADAGGGTLGRLSYHRVAGKPYTISEYDHPAPSLYATEMFPLLAACAGFQDWDGLFQFTYANGNDFTADRITGYFNVASHPGKMVFAPVAALMFRGVMVPPAPAETILEVPRSQVAGLLASGQGNADQVWRAAGAETSLFTQRRVAVRMIDRGDAPRLVGSGGQKPEGGALTLPGAAWQWRPTPTEQAHWTLAADRVAALSGRIGGRAVTAGPLTVTLQPTARNFASVALVALDGQPLSRSAKMLLVLAGAVTNQEMGWNEDFTTVGTKWGRGPTIAEALTAEIRLALTTPGLRVEALDGAGAPREVVPATAAGGLTFRVEPKYQTLWFAVRRGE